MSGSQGYMGCAPLIYYVQQKKWTQFPYCAVLFYIIHYFM